MVFDTHWNYKNVHDYTWHMQILPPSDRVPPDHYKEAILLFVSAANPMPSAKFGWQVLMWYGDPLYLQWCCGHINQESCSYNAPHHFSRTDRWNLYTIFDLPAQQWNFELAYSQIPCVDSPIFGFWLFRIYNRIQAHLFISILMNGYRTVMEAFAC